MLTPAIILEAPPLGRNKHPAPRKRARDEGTVVSLGIEVETALNEAAERCRTTKKWSKRTIWEEAMRRFLIEEGVSVPASQPSSP